MLRRLERAILDGGFRTRSVRLPLLQAEIDFLREHLDLLADEANVSHKKALEKATRLLDQAALILKPEQSDPDEFSRRGNSNILSALKLTQEVRRVEIELMSEESLKLRAEQLRFEIRSDLEAGIEMRRLVY